METWKNKEEFPRCFLIGWCEGVWWSFISMTTVGYGDKAPKSVQARIFSIIWVIIGITTFSLITASLTSVIIAINSSPPPTLEDSNVGVIHHHFYESILVANEGNVDCTLFKDASSLFKIFISLFNSALLLLSRITHQSLGASSLFIFFSFSHGVVTIPNLSSIDFTACLLVT